MDESPSDYESFLKNREIQREVEVPPFSRDDIRVITDTVFIASNPHVADLLFLFGTSHIGNADFDAIVSAFFSYTIPYALVTGYTGKSYFETRKPLAVTLKEELMKRGIPNERILLQDRSTNTLEDVLFGREVLLEHALEPQSILFGAKSHHSGRCFRTLRKQFPQCALYALTFDAEYDGVTISKDSWALDSRTHARVYGEYLRILKYSERGDIA